MINAVMGDFGVLEYSATSAGAVLSTLALLSTGGDALGIESQVREEYAARWYRLV